MTAPLERSPRMAPVEPSFVSSCIGQIFFSCVSCESLLKLALESVWKKWQNDCRVPSLSGYLLVNRDSQDREIQLEFKARIPEKRYVYSILLKCRYLAHCAGESVNLRAKYCTQRMLLFLRIIFAHDNICHFCTINFTCT